MFSAVSWRTASSRGRRPDAVKVKDRSSLAVLMEYENARSLLGERPPPQTSFNLFNLGSASLCTGCRRTHDDEPYIAMVKFLLKIPGSGSKSGSRSQYSTTFHKDMSISFLVILLTDRQTNTGENTTHPLRRASAMFSVKYAGTVKHLCCVPHK